MILEIGIFSFENAGHPDQAVSDGRVELVFEQGQQIEAHPVAQKAARAVAGVFAIAEMVVLQILQHLGLRHIEQRSDHPPAAVIHAAQAFQPAAPDQPEQHFFDLVVAGMANRDKFGTRSCSKFIKGIVTQGAGAGLD